LTLHLLAHLPRNDLLPGAVTQEYTQVRLLPKADL